MDICLLGVRWFPFTNLGSPRGRSAKTQTFIGRMGHPPLLNSFVSLTLYMRLSSYDSQINPIDLSDDPED